MTYNFKEFLEQRKRLAVTESINDKGLFKAVFIVGIPGAGKTYTLGHLNGTISPRIINTDRAAEYIIKKDKVALNADNWPVFFEDRSKRITKEALYHSVNGMLPLFIDGTSSQEDNIMRRQGVLESLGYDVGMIHMKTSLDVALERATKRAKEINRDVPEDFIRDVFSRSEQNAKYFQSRFNFFKTVNNDPGELNNEVLGELFNSVTGFFSADVLNPIGQRYMAELRKNNEKYLVPTIRSEEYIKHKLDAWYSS